MAKQKTYKGRKAEGGGESGIAVVQEAHPPAKTRNSCRDLCLGCFFSSSCHCYFTVVWFCSYPKAVSQWLRRKETSSTC